ncbi:MAG: S8 family peptidase [Firmicutes bacterium]|nr:S8 family peptidase [Bacillota bacterium]
MTDACIYPVTRREPFLSGDGVLIAVIDSGIDYARREFRTEDGSTRILSLWDQTAASGQPPAGFFLGSEYSEAQINMALAASTPTEKMQLVPSIDVSGHGTAVAGIAAGYSPESTSEGTYRYEGLAPNSKLLIVKLGLPSEGGFPRTTEIMRGVTYAIRKALELGMPLVINLSFGNSYGSHDGSSLLERFLDNASEIGRTVICVGSGNEGNSAGHAAGNALSSSATVDLAVADYESSLSVQLWTQYSDSYRIYLRSPGGTRHELPMGIQSGKYTLRVEQTDLLIYLGEPSPYSVNRELYIEMIPASGSYIGSGIWQFILEPVEVSVGQYYFYLPSAAGRNERTGFTAPTPQVTLTIPSTSAKVITVGAYDSTYNSYADFSGRGYEGINRTIGVVTAGLVKPDLAAPGVNLPAPDLYGGYQSVTGTSFATPVVSDSAALLMEWGIVKGNDSFLYGEKIKAYLRRGAQPIRGENVYPNNKVGFGALCTAKSLPI